MSPNSPHHSSFDSEWQQLQIPRSDTASASRVSESPHQKPSTHSRLQNQAVSQDAAGSNRAGVSAAKGPEFEFWANQVLYVDQESGDKDKDLYTFRELFLRSYALENIIVGVLRKSVNADMSACHKRECNRGRDPL